MLFHEPVLANHDHGAFEIFCYSDARTPDEVTARLRKMADVWRETQEGLVFTNLVDFDTLYGHRRDPAIPV